MSGKNNIVLVTGGFDPLHSGHIKLFNEAYKISKKLVIGINSDEWLVRKKGKAFLPFKERMYIINHLNMVYKTISWDDKDNSACGAIEKLLKEFINYNIIFANGGDRKINNTPEIVKFKSNRRVIFKFGVGGNNKENSSSKILEKWRGK